LTMDFRFLTVRLAAPEYNCSAHSPEEWKRLYGERQFALGIWSVTVSCLSWIMLILALVDALFVASESETRELVVFWLWFFGILCGRILFGIQMLIGAVFCSHKTFILVTGLGCYCN
ncbi:hypothetical protein PENTCL1PPCAC_16952, partial [Pristionchus entomophagus]